MNIFLSFFRRSKIDLALSEKVEALQAGMRMQRAENHAVFANYQELSAKLTKALDKIEKLETSNRRLQSRALSIHLEGKANSAEIAKSIKESVLAGIKESAKLFAETRETQVSNTLSIGGVDVQMLSASEPHAYERTIAAPQCEWRQNTTLDQRHYTVADYYANLLPDWAAGKVNQPPESLCAPTP